MAVWNSIYPVSLKYSFDLRQYKWQCSQFSEFNEPDTLLLVSGILGYRNILGEIAIFSLEGDFVLQCRVQNKPYDIFGTWYTDDYLLTGDHRFLGEQISCTVLYVYKASQETESVYTSVMSQLFKIYNKNGLVRRIMIACCPSQDKIIISAVGHNESNLKPKVHSLEDYKCHPEDYNESFSADVCHCDNGEIMLDSRDKYLIFTTGSKTYIPHKVGFKKIRPFTFQERLQFMNLKDKLAEYRERQLQATNRQHPNWLDEDSIQHLFDKVDHYVDLHGYIVGMALSPDHKYLYINSRPWPANCHIANPMIPPPVAEEIDIHVIDMTNLKQTTTAYRSHKAYMPNHECFFMFMDVSSSYVASGAGDNYGYIWDRHYQNCIVKLPHNDVVNSVAFNPCDESVLVTASDDHVVKVWRSLSFLKKMESTH